MKNNKSEAKKKTVNEYLEKSGQVIKYSRSIIDEDPERARSLLISQLEQHKKLLERISNG